MEVMTRSQNADVISWSEPGGTLQSYAYLNQQVQAHGPVLNKALNCVRYAALDEGETDGWSSPCNAVSKHPVHRSFYMSGTHPLWHFLKLQGQVLY